MNLQSHLSQDNQLESAKKFPDLPSDIVLKIALRNKITCLEAKSRKKTTVN